MKDGFQGFCKCCKAVSDKMYQDKSKDKLRARKHAYYLENQEEILGKVKTYRDNNLDKIAEYREQNRDKRLQQKRDWNLDNRERIAEYSKQYNLKNADRIKGWVKSYRLLNQDAMKEKRKLYLEKNSEKVKESQRWYCLNNPDKLHAKSARRRALFKNAFVENVSRIEVYRRDGGICGICGKVINLNIKAPHAESLSLDHVMPLTKGGKHTYLNAQIAHYGCNSRKGNRI